MKKIIVTIILVYFSMLASFAAIEIDGIYYNLVSETKEAEVVTGIWGDILAA